MSRVFPSQALPRQLSPRPRAGRAKRDGLASSRWARRLAASPVHLRRGEQNRSRRPDFQNDIPAESVWLPAGRFYNTVFPLSLISPKFLVNCPLAVNFDLDGRNGDGRSHHSRIGIEAIKFSIE